MKNHYCRYRKKNKKENKNKIYRNPKYNLNSFVFKYVIKWIIIILIISIIFILVNNLFYNTMEDQINTFNNQRILPELEIKPVASNSSNKLPPPLNWQQSYEPITVNTEPMHKFKSS